MLETLAFIPQGMEIWLIVLVILLLFGGAKIPQLMRGIGRGVGELQEGLKETRDKVNQTLSETDPSKTEAK